MSIDWLKVKETLPANSTPLFNQVREAYESCPNDPEAATREVDRLLRERLASLQGRFLALKNGGQA